MTAISSVDLDNHEKVIYINDNSCNLKAIIALHSTQLGPAIGGLRFWPYSNEDEALSDVLRLSKGMSYKCAISNIPFGGGKSVVIQGESFQKSSKLLRKIGETISDLNGQYITGEDVGSTMGDMLALRKVTNHVMGAPLDHGGSGDPSPMTALGCFVGIQASAHYHMNAKDLKGIHIAVQGLGNVGWNLCKQLNSAGATLTVSDISRDRVNRYVDAFGAKAVDTDKIYRTDADIFAPCAMGAILNDRTIPQIKAKIIAGGANNQLAKPSNGEQLRERGILYAPDYVINAGGVIQFAFEYQALKEKNTFDIELVKPKVMSIYSTLLDIFKLAEEKHISTSLAADRIAEEKLLHKAE